LVIAVTYLFSAIAVVILPWRKPDLWFASPASKVKLFGVPIVPVGGVVTIGLLVFNLYEWLSNDAYFVNNHDSLSTWARCTCWPSSSTSAPAWSGPARASTCP
jgi:hypothetical protein